MALLETRGLSKSFGGLKAVSGVDLKVQPGTVHGLIGPNGSGKSTFFNLVTGVYQPDPGSYIEFDGNDITNLQAHGIAALGMARTFQLLRLFSEMTVLENVMVGNHCKTSYGIVESLLGTSRVRHADQKMKEEMLDLLEFIGLANFADIPAGELSGGQRRLLALGRAIAMKPELLLLDEPGAGLSPVNVDKLMETILALKERYKLTVVVVEHILKVVMSTCETISVLDHGQKIAEGPPEMIKNDHAVIEAYLGRELPDEEIRNVIRGQ
ncbi:MAG: ABC transporter ATP-binding protein [SAR324 cluster bacterium]|nr:ABC transporter ATP-binding protein [SAR324 cluster bacterium]